MFMAWSACRRHPDQIPQPGVCPSCLRERLSRIAGNSRFKNTCSSSPSFSHSPVYNCNYHSSVSSSGCSPPSNRRHLHQRVASDIMDSIYFKINGYNGFRKSRSMAYAPRNGASARAVNGKKKGGFWNKLLQLRSSGKKAKF